MQSEQNLKREDELTDVSKMSSLPTEQKHGLIEKAKEALSHLTSKKEGEITEQASEIKQEATEKIEQVSESKPEEGNKGIFGAVKQGIQNISNIITQSVETVKDKFVGHKEETTESKEEPKGEQHTLGERIKEKVTGLKDKITNKDGSTTIIEYHYNDKDQKVKTTRRIRFITHR